MIGMVTPAFNEELGIGRCLQAVNACKVHAALHSEFVEVLVVLDSCTDSPATKAECARVPTVSVNARSVRLARAIGADALLK